MLDSSAVYWVYWEVTSSSVHDTARLTITSDGQQQTRPSLFGTGDSETTFDVSLKSGPATFIFDAISTNGTPLYRGQGNQYDQMGTASR